MVGVGFSYNFRNKPPEPEHVERLIGLRRLECTFIVGRASSNTVVRSSRESSHKSVRAEWHVSMRSMCWQLRTANILDGMPRDEKC